MAFDITNLIPGLSTIKLIAGGIVLASLVGGFVYEDHMIHHYHAKLDQAHDANVVYGARAREATQIAIAQSKQTGDTVTKIINSPSPPSVKIIHDAPIPQDCSTPALDTLRNAV